MKKVLVALALLSMMSCTENQRAKTWGGTMTIDLPAGKKLVEATWKDHDLWYLVRDRKEGESVDTFTFHEESSFGLMEGTVVFKEH